MSALFEGYRGHWLSAVGQNSTRVKTEPSTSPAFLIRAPPRIRTYEQDCQVNLSGVRSSINLFRASWARPLKPRFHRRRRRGAAHSQPTEAPMVAFDIIRPSQDPTPRTSNGLCWKLLAPWKQTVLEYRPLGPTKLDKSTTFVLRFKLILPLGP